MKSSSLRPSMLIHSSKTFYRIWFVAGALLASLCAQHALAHTDANEAIADTPGLKLGISAVVTSLSAPQRLPSQGLPGYLLQGDPGVDRRATQLEHAVVQAGYRLNDTFGAQLAWGAHGADPTHVEAAWLQARGTLSDTFWTLGAGRQRPSLGTVVTRAGHLDRFSLTPLAKQAITTGDWIEDGAELGLKRQWLGLDWTLDAGLWAGHSFPGSSTSDAFPSLHLGAQWGDAFGDWTLDGFAAQLDPTGRGSRIISSNGAHTHATPVCDASMNGVVCFDGRSRLTGISGQWVARTLPITVTGALLWRNEQGTLQSRNGFGQYDGLTRGDWLELVWRISPQWEVALRNERLNAQHTLVGGGASLVATEAGFGNYTPQRRTALTLGYSVNPWVDVRIEAGREHADTQSVTLVTARLILNWDRALTVKAP
jgi:hypothetical protein